MSKKKKDKPFNFKDEVMEVRKRIPEDDYSSSQNCFAVTIKTRKAFYPELFSLFIGLIFQINETMFNSQLITGARVKTFQGNSWKRKRWCWYGRKSFAINNPDKKTGKGFTVLPFASLATDLGELWLANDRWEIELYTTTDKPNDDQISSTLTFYSYAIGIEFLTNNDDIGKFIRAKVESKLTSQEDMEIYYGLAALEVVTFVMLKNT